MSIVKISELAGVGIGTVSRYINDPSKVSAASSRKILKAIKETGYRPRARRPGPKTKERVGISTGVVQFLTIGDITPDKLLSMPVFPILLTGIQKVLMQHGLNLMFCHSRGGDDIPEMLDSKFCDGVIIQSMDRQVMSDGLRKKLKKIPGVWCFRNHSDFNNEFDHVFYNNDAVGAIAANYMQQKGHKKVAYISSSSTHSAFNERKEKFIRSCNEYGIEVVPIIFEEDEKSLICKRSLSLCKELVQVVDSVSAIFYCSDDTMLGVYNEMRNSGIDISRVEMLGCNNEAQFLDHIYPRPDTIDIRLGEVGEQAVSRLLSRINGTETGPVVELLINPQLITGDADL